jgi:hypothetical protein
VWSGDGREEGIGDDDEDYAAGSEWREKSVLIRQGKRAGERAPGKKNSGKQSTIDSPTALPVLINRTPPTSCW